MANIPSVFVSREEIDADVKQAIGTLGPDAVRVNYNVGDDSGGDPAIYFRIVLADSAALREAIGPATRTIERVLMNHIHPYSRWGLIPYFSFRSVALHDDLLELAIDLVQVPRGMTHCRSCS